MDNLRTLDGMASDNSLYTCVMNAALLREGEQQLKLRFLTSHLLMTSYGMRFCSFFANQQDFSNALSTIEMAEKLYAGLQTVLSGNCTVMDTEKVCFHKGDCDYTLPSTSAFFATFLLYFIGPLMVMYCSSNPFFSIFCLLVARQRS